MGCTISEGNQVNSNSPMPERMQTIKTEHRKTKSENYPCYIA